MAEPKFSTGLWVLGKTADRFASGGYGPEVSVEEMIERATRVEGAQAVEVHQTDFDSITVDKLKKLLKDGNLLCSNVNTNVWSDPKFKHGAFTNRDPKIRADALAEARKSVDLAREIGSPGAALWLGADGFDYPFQVDYTTQWDLEVSGVREIGEYAAPDIKVGVEYKLKEPRTHMTIGSVGKALALSLEVGLDNVGVTIDFGHALMSRENPGESVAYLNRRGKLFNVHLNDAYGEWDDDMIAGVINFWETLEFLYYCKETNYQGWFALDMFPYREDGVEAATMAIKNTKATWELLDKLDVAALKKAQETMDAIATQNVVRKVIFSD